MQAGKLRTLVELQSRQPGAVNREGESVAEWVTFAWVWAEILDTGGAESRVGDAVVGNAQTKLKIRWRGDVTPAHRVLLDASTVLEIAHVADPDKRRRELILSGRETKRE